MTDLRYFSVPGRVELGGNHTDHNNGRVLTGAINLKTEASVKKRVDDIIRIDSEGYGLIQTTITDLEPFPNERETSLSLVKGILKGFINEGYRVGGFEAKMQSNIIKGSGLSSSAAFEILICTILNSLYNDFSISTIKLAQIAQYAENNYFFKPSGMMDQLNSIMGGILYIDFHNERTPSIDAFEFDFRKHGYELCIVRPGGDHTNLTREYSQIPHDMKTVAQYFNKDTLGQVSYQDLLDNIPELRKFCSDRALLRSLHFMEENLRVKEEYLALTQNRFNDFLELVIASGRSSAEYLQNIFDPNQTMQQGLTLALFLAEKLLKNCGAWRVHGGGFAGTTLNIVPLDKFEYFKDTIEAAFGLNSCILLKICKSGALEL